MTKKTGVKNRRLLIAKNSIMMLVMLVVVFLAAFAWYADTSSVTASTSSVSVTLPAEVKAALPDANNTYPTDGSLYSSTLDLSSYVHPLYSDATSDGKTFIVPDFSNTDDAATGKVVNLNGEWRTANSYADAVTNDTGGLIEDNDYQYLTFDFYLRSAHKDFSVTASSYLQSKTEADGDTLASPNTDNKKSSYGNFSVDSLVGAIRTSVVGANVKQKSGSTETYNTSTSSTTNYKNAAICRFLWVPRPDIYLRTRNASTNAPYDIGDWTLETSNLPAETARHDYFEGMTSEGANSEVVNSGVEKHEGDLDYAYASDVTKVTGGSDGTRVPILGQDCPIVSADENATTVSITENGVSKQYYVFRVTINLWIEGSDSEARRAMDGGEFKLALNFA